MPRVIYDYIERQRAEGGATGTATYDLPKDGFIPEIVLRAYSTPTAAVALALPLNDAITAVEIMDSGNVIKSYNGNQIRALQMIHDRKELTLTEWDMHAVESYGDFKIILAKEINGVKYCPNFGNFANPQIKVSWDYSQVLVKGVTYDADVAPAMQFTVLPKIVFGVDHGYTHGYIKTTVQKIHTMAASAEFRTVIPVGDPLIGIMVDAGYDALHFTDDVNEIELKFNNKEWVPFHFYAEEVNTIMDAWFDGPFTVNFLKAAIDAVEIDVHMGFTVQFVAEGIGTTLTLGNLQTPNDGIETMGLYDLALPNAIAAFEKTRFEAEGYLPFNCFYIPMKALNNGTGDIVDTTRWKTIELIFNSSAAANAASRPKVLTEYLIT